ncbi:MAG: hypothetical protein N2746_06715 [Deltaproteobacteria bacterium]|nr:hypothetical protein [Deltaproteobacteria bacterium]
MKGKVFLIFVLLTLTVVRVYGKDKEHPSLIVFDIAAEEGVKKGVSNLLTEMVMVEIAKMKRFKVIGQKDLDKMLFWETNKQLKNCTDSSCLMQIAGAMGAEYYVEGSVGAVGDRYIVTLKLMDALKASVINRLGEAVDKNENVMLETVINMTRNLMKPLIGEDVKVTEVKREVPKEKEEVKEEGRFIIGARGYFDATSKGGSYDLSIGYKLTEHLSISTGFGMLRYPIVKPRLTISINPKSKFEFYGVLQGSLISTENVLSYGVGIGPVGMRYKINRIFSLLVEIPLEYYLQLPEEQEKFRLLITGGIQVNL